MNTPNILRALWRRLPLPPQTKARIRQALLRQSPALQAAMGTAAVSTLPATLTMQTVAAPMAATEMTAAETPMAAPHDVLNTLCRQPGRITARGQRDWIVFGIIGWDFRIQRPQHLARELARAGETVFYIEPNFVADAQPGFQVRQLDPDLSLFAVQLHLKGAPQIYFAHADADQSGQLAQSMALLWAQWGIHAATAMVQHPYWTPLALSLPNTLQVYDCMDHHEGFGGMPQDLVALEHEYMARADVVTVTSQWLHDWAASQGRSDAVVVRNGCDYDHFHAPVGTPYQASPPRKVIGYFGAIAHWFDVELVAKLAQRFSDCEILLVGDDTQQAGRTLGRFANVRMLGERPYGELPQFLHGFDVCLLPFLQIPLTLATNPVKVYEYLCAGAEVVCTDLPEIAQFGDLVHRAGSHEAFIAAVDRALNAPADAAQRARRRAFALGQTWSYRAQALRQSVETVQWPSVSVVVLTYNNWAYTKACLQSLFTRTQYPGNWEVVVADNASTDETVDRLKEWAEEEPRMKLVLNSSNLGFSAGNNTGLAAATGDYLVLLNNDTVVTDGWLLTMLRHFQGDSTLGLLGPATNHIGNESKVPVHYDTLHQMPAAARGWTLAHMGQTYAMRTLAFFCVMMPRTVYDKVGPLDENFGRGFFEDDDYCRRIEQLGLRMACADDVLVHHRLSASFDKVDSGERQALFTRNKAYYESKWGEWVPHVYRKH